MSILQLRVHSSQFPEAVRQDLLHSLRIHQIPPKFHYDSLKQAEKWLAIQKCYSPWCTDLGCLGIYQLSFQKAAQMAVSWPCVELIGLGCGSGQKEADLLRLLTLPGRLTRYIPCDVSSAMVLMAAQTAASSRSSENCHPLVCDLNRAQNWKDLFPEGPSPADPRIITCFGMLPNFEPDTIFPRLRALLQPGNLLLLSANLAPGPSYTTGMNQVFPLYDNILTREWLLTFLLDLGVERSDGEIYFSIEDCPMGLGLKRFIADFTFSKNRMIHLEGEQFEFCAGNSIRLFFSYRHTPALLRELLAQHQMEMIEQWTTPSEEEVVFLCRSIES